MDAFLTSISSVAIIMIMIAVGYLCEAKKWFRPHFSKSISNLLMNVALPVSIFVAMLNDFDLSSLKRFSVGLLYSSIGTVLTVIAAWLLVKALNIRRGRRGLMILGITAPNTLFIGVPLNLSLFGELSVPYVLVYYVVHIFLIWTLGVYLIAIDDPTGSNEKVSFDWHNLFPAPVWGLIISLPFVLIPSLNSLTKSTDVIMTPLTDISGLVTPLALIYIGIMLKKFGIFNMEFDRDALWTYAGRFIMVPFITAVLIHLGNTFYSDIGSVFTQTLIIQSALPALAVLPILAGRYHGDVKFATNIVVATSVLFVVIVPIVMLLMNM